VEAQVKVVKMEEDSSRYPTNWTLGYFSEHSIPQFVHGWWTNSCDAVCQPQES